MVVWMDGASKQRNQKLGKILFWREKNVGFESLEDQENHDYVMIAFNDSSFLALSQSWWAQPWLKGTNRKSLTYLPTYLPSVWPDWAILFNFLATIFCKVSKLCSTIWATLKTFLFKLKVRCGYVLGYFLL